MASDIEELEMEFPEIEMEPVNRTVSSDHSGGSTTMDNQEFLKDTSLTGGVIKFLYDGASEEKAQISYYVSVPSSAPLEDMAKYMTKVWGKKSPDIILSVISDVKHYSRWKNEKEVADFQEGITQAANTTEMWILTNGLDGGITKLIGDAISDEQERRQILKTDVLYRYSAVGKPEKLTKLTLIGVVPKYQLSYASDLDGKHSSPLPLKNQGRKPESDILELNSNHTHFIMSEDLKDLKELENFRLQVEERFLSPVGSPKRYRKLPSVEDSDDNINEDLAPMESTIIHSTSTPLVGLLIQGGPLEIDHVLDLVKRNVPVVVVKGSGLAADLVSFAHHEIHQNPDPEHVESFIKPILIKKIMQCFPDDFLDDEITRNRCRDMIIEIIEVAQQGEQKYLTMLDLNNEANGLKNLNKYLLLALFRSQTPKKGKEFQEQFQSDIKLTLDWNRCDLALEQIFQKHDWTKIMVSNELFDRALLMKDREDFVDLFLERDAISIHKYLNHKKLVYLFNNVADSTFFLHVCLEGVLSKISETAYPLNKNFVKGTNSDLNQLLYHTTYLQNMVCSQELSKNYTGNYVTDAARAERKALYTLIFWSTLVYNPKLTKVLWKRTDQPMAMAIIISMIWNNLSNKWCKDVDMQRRVKESAAEFGKMAVQILDLSYNDSAVQAIACLDEKLPDFNNYSIMEIAHMAENKYFIAHQVCQKWLNQRWIGNLQIREVDYGPFNLPDWLKIYLSIALVFPMFVWITYEVKSPLHLTVTETGEVVDEEEDDDDEVDAKMMRQPSIDENWQDRTAYDLWKMRVTRMFNYGRRNLRVPIHMQFYYLWSAPITKFWLNQISYIIYLIVFSLAVGHPLCGNLALDLLVIAWTITIWLEIVRGTILKKRLYKEENVFWTVVEIFLIGGFILLIGGVRILPHFLYYMDYKTTKIIMSLGLLYFYYRTIMVFLPISPVLGPMLISINRMIQNDFLTWMRMFIIFMTAGGISIQAVIYPNFPFGGEWLKLAFSRAFFAMFLTKIDDLDGDDSCSFLYNNQSSEVCLDTETSIFVRNTSTMVAKELETCPYSSFGGYFFVIQYLLITKLVLLTLLYALFSATTAEVKQEAEAIWKFQKYSLIVDFETQLRMPPPLNLISYFFMLLMFLYRKIKFCCKRCCGKGWCCFRKKHDQRDGMNKISIVKTKRSMDYNYWKSCVKRMIGKEETAKEERELVQTQFKKVELLLSQNVEQKQYNQKLTEQMIHLERSVMNCNLALEQVKHMIKNLDPKNRMVSLHSATVHTASRQSPYPYTRIQRFPVFDKYVSWEVMYNSYDPILYTAPTEEFPDNAQSFIDPDFLQIAQKVEEKSISEEDLLSLKSEKPMMEPLWNNSATYKLGDADIEINRISWITEDGTPCRYSLDTTDMPQNPKGRTGLRGRGRLWRWGPNHYVVIVLSRFKRKFSFSGKEEEHIIVDGKKVLEVITVHREETGECALPAGKDYGIMTMYSAVCKNFLEQVIGSSNINVDSKMTDQDMIAFFKKYAKIESGPMTGFSASNIYKGYMDDPSNTDNAWKEAEVWNIHFGVGDSLDEHMVEKEKRWKEATSYIHLYGNQGLIVQDAAQRHNAYY